MPEFFSVHAKSGCAGLSRSIIQPFRSIPAAAGNGRDASRNGAFAAARLPARVRFGDKLQDARQPGTCVAGGWLTAVFPAAGRRTRRAVIPIPAAAMTATATNAAAYPRSEAR